jgi:hypothetical protein
MIRKRLVWLIVTPVTVILLGGIIAAFLFYRGTYLGEQPHPQGGFSLRYYKSYNPFQMVWSMPGDSACTPEWVRLYNRDGEKLNELYSTNCKRGMEPHWLEGQVILPDGETIWSLPQHP